MDDSESRPRWPSWVLGGLVVVVVSVTTLAEESQYSATIPVDLTGRSATAVRDRLATLGFNNVIYASDTGKTVVANPGWSVTSVEGAGTTVATDTPITVRVVRGGG